MLNYIYNIALIILITTMITGITLAIFFAIKEEKRKDKVPDWSTILKERSMTSAEAINELIRLANDLQIIPNTPIGKAIVKAIEALEKEGD